MVSNLTTATRTLSTRDVRRTVLDNGLTILTREAHTSPTVSSMVWYGVGSRNEQAGETGRSHFLEHMLFKGTERFRKGEIDLLTMKNGGSNNAFTSYDFTAYYFSFAADRWEIGIDIEADRMTHTLFDPAEFDAEKQVVIEELKAGLDQPWGLLMQQLNATAFQRHPYRNPVIGWLPDVEAATVEGMKAYYRQHYHPANATVVLVGDFETDRVLEKVSKAFAAIPSGLWAPDPTTEEPVQDAERRFELEWRSEVPRLAIAFHTPGIGHRDSYALQVLAVVLAEGKASRLYQRVVERERATNFITAEYAESRDNTLFYVRGEARGDVPPAAIEASIDDELERIADAGVTPAELRRAQHQIEAHFVFSMERSLDQAMLFGQIETLDRLEYIDQYLPSIHAVDPAEVARVCGQYLTRTNRTVGLLVGGAEGASS
jgi:zinc protease